MNAPTTPWTRLHRALMPDYNRKAAAYWWLAVLSGSGVVATALIEVLSLGAADLTVVLAGVVLAMVTGFFPVRIPRWKNAFTAGEVFLFLLLLVHGPAAATVAAAGECLLGSWRTSKRWTSRLASPAMAALAMYAIGSAVSHALHALQAAGLANPGLVLLVTMAGAVAYFLGNTLLITAVGYLKRSSWPEPGELFGNFGWIGVTYAASASIASLLFLSAKEAGIGVLLAAAPIIALLVVTLHYFFRQQEVDEAARLARLDAAEREAELAAAHVRELRASEQRFHSAFSHASIGMALVAFDNQVLQGNAALRDLLGYAQETELASRPVTELVDPRDAEEMLANLRALQSGRTPSFSFELRLRPRSGDELWAAVHGSLFAQGESDTPCLILQIQDVTARREAEAGLQHIAFHDALTGLPNRHRFQQLISAALDRARAVPGSPFALMFLDFDRFKLINDSLGHAVGDEFLVAVSKRIQQQLRPGDVVARLGGDEFAVLAMELVDERIAEVLADRLLEALRQPFQIAGTDISTSVSIGITFSGTGYTTTTDMLRDADIAMYRAKAAGKGRYALFDAKLHTEVSHRLRLERDLRRAVDRGQISVDYQPVFDLASGRITGFEALARWNHAEYGAIDPDVFLPVAEEAGVMVALTDFVLRSACRQLRAWQQRDPMFAGMTLAVNLSGIDVAHPNLVTRVNTALVEAELRPHDLVLEMTENTLMTRLEGALPALTTLRQSGVGLSVDDFGTGYSSLRHLSTLPISGLKLAPGFVADLQRGTNSLTIVQAIVMMAASLGKSLTAESIETKEQLSRLREAGCESGQGFFLSRPLHAQMVDRLLERIVSQRGSLAPTHRDTSHSLFH